MEIYVVRAGDNVDGIAASLGVPVNEIIYDNQLVYPYELAVGQALLIEQGESGERITGEETGLSRTQRREISVSGYAYPFISQWVLGQTLPFLSELPVFSYGFTGEGELIAPLWDDEWMVREAAAYRVRPVLTLTPFGPDGRFNNALISSVVNNDSYVERLIQNLLRVMERKGYTGWISTLSIFWPPTGTPLPPLWRGWRRGCGRRAIRPRWLWPPRPPRTRRDFCTRERIMGRWGRRRISFC